jgi:photosystem II stability/assembly factor-like uncharacterized protein
MRCLLLLFAAATALAQTTPQTRISRITENLRGVSTVSQKIAWASGTHGTYLRTTDGHLWIPDHVPGADSLDFRGIVAFSADEAFLMSSGPGDQSRIYHTSDAGRHWQLQFTNTNEKGFFDSVAFWDRTHGIVLGDPIPDETGTLKFELLMTDDGQTWIPIPPAQLPPALEGEAAFAASNTCLAILNKNTRVSETPVIPSAARDLGFPATAANTPVILSGDTWSAERSMCRSRRTPCIPPSSATSQGVLTHAAFTTAQAIPLSGQGETPASPKPEEKSAPDPNIWFATGGRAARVFHSPDRGHTWEVFDTPIIHGPDSAGIFSIAFRDATHGVIAGGDYKLPQQDGPNLAFTADAGKTWTLSKIFPQSYYSAAAYDRHTKKFNKDEAQDRIFLVGTNFIYDFRPPQNPTRISAQKKSDSQFNAVSPYPQGGALAVGPKGTIITVP